MVISFGNIRNTALITGVYIFFGVTIAVFGQVEHNYEVGPQSANCDTLDFTSSSVKDAIAVIELTTFRYQQQFKISRTYGVMNARFFSCDGQTGYLVIKVDKIDHIYLDVPENIWKGLISSVDINGFYDTEIKGRYDLIKDEGE